MIMAGPSDPAPGRSGRSKRDELMASPKRPSRPGTHRPLERDELMASLTQPDWPGRIARGVAATVILLAAGWSPSQGQPQSSQVADNLEDTVAIAVRIAGERDTEARAAQAAASLSAASARRASASARA